MVGLHDTTTVNRYLLPYQHHRETTPQSNLQNEDSTNSSNYSTTALHPSITGIVNLSNVHSAVTDEATLEIRTSTAGRGVATLQLSAQRGQDVDAATTSDLTDKLAVDDEVWTIGRDETGDSVNKVSVSIHI